MGRDAPPAEELAVLRRRLYAPDATEQDRERYAAAVAAQALTRSAEPPNPEPEPEPEPPQAPAPPALDPPTRRTRRVALLIAAVAVLAVGAAVAASALAPRPESAPQPRPSIAAAPLTVPDSARDTFAASLLRGGPADLARYLFDHPEARPPELTTLTRAATEEHSGTGGTTVSLEPSTEANQGGHVSVILTLGVRNEATWRVARVAVDRVQLVALRTTVQTAGLPYSATTAYPGRAPTLLSISVPRGTRWDALVVFSN